MKRLTAPPILLTAALVVPVRAQSGRPKLSDAIQSLGDRAVNRLQMGSGGQVSIEPSAVTIRRRAVLTWR